MTQYLGYYLDHLTHEELNPLADRLFVSQYLLLCERITKAEKQLIDQARHLHVGKTAPEMRIHVRVNRTFRSGSSTA